MSVVAHEPVMRPLPKERILGHPVHAVSMTTAAATVVDLALKSDTGGYVCLTNVHTTVESQRSPELREAVDNAVLSVPDGMPLAFILRRRGHVHTEQIAGIELVPRVATAGLADGLRHFFYGGGPGVAHDAARGLRELVPGAQVAGALSTPVAAVDALPVQELRRELDRTRPHILWVGLGAPKQELWMARMSGTLQVPVMIGVGAVFDYLAGTKPAAPVYLRRLGLEWLFRLAVEPRRLWRRYLVGNSTFVWLLARERLTNAPRTPAQRKSSGRGTGRKVVP